MATSNTDYLQQFASIGVPGAWITDDVSIVATTIKMGGFPKYFYLWQKTKEQSICLSCKQKMYLLAQINAPLMEEQCQRNIYVFMCCNAKCTKTNRGWNVMVHRGPSISTAMYAKQHKSHNNDDPYVDGTDHEIHKMIKHNNKTKSNRTTSSSLDTDSFWNTNLNSATAKPEQMDSEMQHKLNGLNDDFSRLMQMQNQLLNEVDKQSKASGKKKKKKKQVKKNKKSGNTGKKKGNVKKKAGTNGRPKKAGAKAKGKAGNAKTKGSTAKKNVSKKKAKKNGTQKSTNGKTKTKSAGGKKKGKVTKVVAKKGAKGNKSRNAKKSASVKKTTGKKKTATKGKKGKAKAKKTTGKLDPDKYKNVEAISLDLNNTHRLKVNKEDDIKKQKHVKSVNMKYNQ
eukprot:1164118_1